MSQHEVRVEGELYLSLATVADVYEIQIVLLREAYDQGLLGVGHGSGSGVCIAAFHLDRVATIVRMHRVLGLDIESIALALATGGP